MLKILQITMLSNKKENYYVAKKTKILNYKKIDILLANVKY